MCLPENEGVYCVVFNLAKPIIQKIGKLGVGDFAPGLYFYCGSAKGHSGLNGRIQRHLRKDSTKFWHIDYLKTHLEPLRVWFVFTKNESECGLVNALCDNSNIDYAMVGFGASDCSHHCRSHLLFANSSTNIDQVFDQLSDGLPRVNQYWTSQN